MSDTEKNQNAQTSFRPSTSTHNPDAREIHARAILIDMHADTVQRIVDENVDLQTRLPDGHLDAVRMREGGLTAQFFAIWVEPNYYGTGGRTAIERADKQINAVRALAEKHPETWLLATNTNDIRRAKREGKLAALLGLEGGYALDEKLENIEKYFRLGVSYMSPVWTVSLSWAGSSGDAIGQTRGLNEFGRAVIREMNRLGMLIDVSHISDKSFWDIIETSTSPIVATHSNARALCAVSRNLTDEQICAIAKTSGVVNVVFYPAFIESSWNELKSKVDAEIMPLLEQVLRETQGTESQKRIAKDKLREREFARRLPPVPISRLVDHIEHIVKLTGIEHVGIGSDFDGIQATPKNLSSVAELPNLTAELLRRGFGEDDVTNILGGNMLRVLEQMSQKENAERLKRN
ncbi:MAG: dipeptidase [Pyrinomonadaceae bacterium]